MGDSIFMTDDVLSDYSFSNEITHISNHSIFVTLLEQSSAGMVVCIGEIWVPNVSPKLMNKSAFIIESISENNIITARIYDDSYYLNNENKYNHTKAPIVDRNRQIVEMHVALFLTTFRKITSVSLMQEYIPEINGKVIKILRGDPTTLMVYDYETQKLVTNNKTNVFIGTIGKNLLEVHNNKIEQKEVVT